MNEELQYEEPFWLMLTLLCAANFRNTGFQRLFEASEEEFDSVFDEVVNDLRNDSTIPNAEELADKLIANKDNSRIAMIATRDESKRRENLEASRNERMRKAKILLESDDWESRLLGEIIECDVRMVKLKDKLGYMSTNDIDYEVSKCQLVHMNDYYGDMVLRANLNGIVIPDDVETKFIAMSGVNQND